VSGIKDALKGAKLHYAYDAVSEHNSYTNIVQVLEPAGHLTLVLPGKQYEGIPDSVQKTVTTVGEAHKGDKEFAYVYFRYLARGLAEGWFTPHPYEVVEGGLEGVEGGLRNLKEGKASAVKYVFKIGEAKL
jgi:NADPH2:quinone reductase